MIKGLITDFDEKTDDALIFGIPIYEALKKLILKIYLSKKC